MHRNLKIVTVVAASAFAFSGCMVVPLPDGRHAVVQPIPPTYPSTSSAASSASQPQASALTLSARLYPTNSLAISGGLLNGTVVNYLNGRGEFQLMVDGERLVGEATRVRDAANQGIANATGARGTFMNCRYQMSNPTRGTGTCLMSNGAEYTLHISG
jgi:hypothetical protein